MTRQSPIGASPFPSLLLLQPIPTATEFIGDLTCLSSYALCAYANCTYSGDYNAIPYYNGQKTSGPAHVANCGCQPVLPSQFPAGSPYNTGSSAGILEKVGGGRMYRYDMHVTCAAVWLWLHATYSALHLSTACPPPRRATARAPSRPVSPPGPAKRPAVWSQPTTTPLRFAPPCR